MKQLSKSLLTSVFFVLACGFTFSLQAQREQVHEPDVVIGERPIRETTHAGDFKEGKDPKGGQAQPVPETAQQRIERQIREYVERRMQNRTADEIAQGWLIGEKAQRENFARIGTFEILERERKAAEAERARVEQDRINRQKKAAERSERSVGGRN